MRGPSTKQLYGVTSTFGVDQTPDAAGVDAAIAAEQAAFARDCPARYLLHVTYLNGATQTLTFPTILARDCHVLLLAGQPVTLRIEDRS